MKKCSIAQQNQHTENYADHKTSLRFEFHNLAY
jgi:hypothetical protein